jgi:type I restriction enzyme, S subunit
VTVLPSGWVKTQLGDLCHFNPKHPAGTDRNTKASFVPMSAVSEVFGTIQGHDVRPLEEMWKGYTHFQDGDVIFAKITPCMENGKIAVANGLHEGLACGSTEFTVLRPSEGISPRYIWYFLRQETFRKDAERHMTGAVGQRRVPVQYLRSQALPLPPAKEQRRVVAKLDSLFGRTRRAREELGRISRLVEHYKQVMLTAAFSGELTREWRHSRGLVAPPLVTLGSVASNFSYGSAAKSSRVGSIPVLRMGNIQNGKLDWRDLVYTSDVEEIEKYRLRSGDVLFNRTNSPQLVGKTALYSGEREAIYAGYLIRVRCLDDLAPPYLVLVYCLNSPGGREYCWSAKTDGVSQSNINAKKLAAFLFLLPTLPEQYEIIARIETSFAWLDRVAAEQARASELITALDKAILAKALRGELVPQDPRDEPATTLLERVCAQSRGTPSKEDKRRKKKSPRSAGSSSSKA